MAACLSRPCPVHDNAVSRRGHRRSQPAHHAGVDAIRVSIAGGARKDQLGRVFAKI
jgi:hypothetical protein